MSKALPVSPGLHKFNGGIHLPTNKEMSAQRPVAEASLPERLILPLQQHIGQIAEPVIKQGEQVLKGQVIARAAAYVSAPLHAPTSGTVSFIGDMPVPHPSGLNADCIVIQPDGRDEWCPLQPIEDYTQVDPITLRNKVREAGIVGLGGAAFPSSVKLNPGPSREVELLVINGAECEPYITCDQTLMSEQAEEVIGGIQIIMHTIGVDECWIGIEDTMPTAYEGLTSAIKAAGLSGRIQVKVVPTIYPTGGEKQLIKVLTGREVPSNGLPADIGIVCHNPGTAAAIHRAITKGEPLISRLVTITGHGVAEPRNVKALFGTPMAHLVEAAGGYTDKAERLIMGGPMMGFAVHTDELPIVKATNCVLVAEAKEVADPHHADPCIRCGACADACPASLLPQQLYWFSKSRQFDTAQDDYNLFDCIECGCCSYVCPSNIPLVQYYRFAKTEIRTAEADKRKADRAKERHDFRLERLEREQREKAEAMRKKKEELARKKAQASGGSSDAKQDAIAAAVARAQARKAKLAEEGQTPKNTDHLSQNQQEQVDKADSRRQLASEEAKAAAIAAAKARAAGAKADTAKTGDAKAAAIAAAKAKAQARTAGTDAPATDPKKAAIEAAKKRAQEKKQIQGTSADSAKTDPKQAAIAAAKAKALAKTQGGDKQGGEESAPGDARKAAIEAAKQRALAKTRGKAQAEDNTAAEKPADAKQAAIAAAKARALAKAKGEAPQDAEKPAASDPQKAAIEAAKQRALAKNADSETSDVPAKDPAEAKKQAIKAARERALAKAKAKDS